jgi:hypothetical protein
MPLRAYLAGGTFGIHRDGRRNREKEARRSDSAGAPREYDSRDEAAAGLWPDIIAGDPDFYAAPAALARPAAETAFPGGTSALADASHGGGGSEQGDAARVQADTERRLS